MEKKMWSKFPNVAIWVVCFAITASLFYPAFSKENIEQEHWWTKKPMRLIQTNLREIDASLDVDTYVNSIKTYNANVVIFNVGGIVANYETELPYQYKNPNMTVDFAGEIIKKLNAAGIRLIARFDFSKLNETLAFQKPEWLYKSVKGDYVNYNGQVHTCFNGGYRQNYVFDIIGEVIDKYPIDAIFVNMHGYQDQDYSRNYHGVCQSDACRKRFNEWSGGLNLPTEQDYNDSTYLVYQKFREYTTSELFTKINTFAKEKNPDIAVCTYHIDGVDIIRSETATAFNERIDNNFLSTSNTLSNSDLIGKASTNSIVHFMGFRARHAGVSENLSKNRLLQSMLNAQWLDYYVIGHLDNQEDRRSLPLVKEIYQFHADNEELFVNVKSKAKICLIRPYHSWSEEYFGMLKILAEKNYTFDIKYYDHIDEYGKGLNEYDVLVLPDADRLTDGMCQLFDNYVKKGGKILATGNTSMADITGNLTGNIRIKALGIEKITDTLTEFQGSYISVSSKDKKDFNKSMWDDIDIMYLHSNFHICKPVKGCQGYLQFIHPDKVMFGPPEKCYYTDKSDTSALYLNSYAKGKTVYIPWFIGKHYYEKANETQSLLVESAIDGLLNFQKEVQVNNPFIQLTHFAAQRDDYEWIGMINHSGQLNNSYYTPIPLVNISMSLKTIRKPKSVILVNSGKSINFDYQEGRIKMIIDELKDFEMIKIDYH